MNRLYGKSNRSKRKSTVMLHNGPRNIKRRRAHLYLSDLHRIRDVLVTVQTREAAKLAEAVSLHIKALEAPRARTAGGGRPCGEYVVTLPDSDPVVVAGAVAVAKLIGRTPDTIRVYLSRGKGAFSVPTTDRNGNPAIATVSRQELTKTTKGGQPE